MARRTWSAEDLAEIRKRWSFGFTYAEIAEHFEVSRQAVVLTVRRHKLIDPVTAMATAHQRSRGAPKSEATRQKLSEAQKARWTPERKVRTSETVKARRATEVGKDEVRRALQTVARNKRGFDLPDHLRDEYFASAQEATRAAMAKVNSILFRPVVADRSEAASDPMSEALAAEAVAFKEGSRKQLAVERREVFRGLGKGTLTVETKRRRVGQ